MKRLALAVLLCANLASAATLKIALPGLRAVQLDEKVGGFITEQLGLELSKRGADVVSQQEIASLLGYERQRQLLGCDDKDSSCVAELGNALGADALIVGDVAKLGSRYQLTVKALSTSTAQRLATWSGGASSEEDLLRLTAEAAAALVPEIAKRTGRTTGPVTTVATEHSSTRSYALYPAIAGGVLVVGGLVAEGVAYSKYTTLKDHPPSSNTDATNLANSGKSWQTAFAVGASVGVAALLAAGALYAFGDDGPTVSAALTPEGGGAAVTFAIP